MQVGTGKSVLNGIAIGKLKIYKKKDTAISTAPVADTAAELERFEAARQKAIEQQTALYEKALAEAGEDIAEVFNIHAMMLDDDDFVDAIKEIINSQKKCAEYAVKTAGNNQAAVFAAMDDPYLQARSADVLDIAQAMLDILQGVDNASLQGTEPSILVAEDLAPSETVRMDKSLLLGFITREGSSNSHTAILARSMNIPALIQCKDIQDDWDGKMAGRCSPSKARHAASRQTTGPTPATVLLRASATGRSRSQAAATMDALLTSRKSGLAGLGGVV